MKYVIVLSVVITACAMCTYTEAKDIHIVHFGDSITATSYLPREQSIPYKLETKLRKAYSNPRIFCYNVSKGGSTIKKFMAKGSTYEKKCLKRIKKMDLCFIQFGVNDESAYGPDEFKTRLADMCDRILKDYPGTEIVLCTSMRCKSPGWWKMMGKNAEEKISKNYYSKIREFAKKRGYLLVDIYERLVREMRKGKWDIHIRNQKLSKKYYKKVIVDNSKDTERKGDKDKWFKDGHPNPNGTEIIAELEVEVLKKAYPKKLFKRGKAKKTEKKGTNDSKTLVILSE